MQRTVILCVVFGAYGDLFKKKLLRALYFFWKGRPPGFELRLIAVDIKNLAEEGLNKDSWLARLAEYNEIQDPGFSRFSQCVTYLTADCYKADQYEQLRREVAKVQEAVDALPQAVLKKFYYFALPPYCYVKPLQHVRCLPGKHGDGDRIVLEKPIGIDRDWTGELYEQIGGRFPPSDVLVMDHFGFKPHVPYLLAKLYEDSVRNELYNEQFVDRVLIYAFEKIGAEERGFPGTLLDSFQSHLLFLYGLCWEDPLWPPEEGRWKHFPGSMRMASLCFNLGTEPWRGLGRWLGQETLRAYGHAQKWATVPTPEYYVQLARAVDEEGKILPWHREHTETAARLVCFPAGPRWLNRVPFEFRHAKYADRKETGIVVYFKPRPASKTGSERKVWRFIVEREQTTAGGSKRRQHGLIEETHLLETDGSSSVQQCNEELIDITRESADGYPEALRCLFLGEQSVARLLPPEFQFSTHELIVPVHEYLYNRFAEDPSRWLEYPVGTNPFPENSLEIEEMKDPPGFWIGPYGKARHRNK